MNRPTAPWSNCPDDSSCRDTLPQLTQAERSAKVADSMLFKVISRGCDSTTSSRCRRHGDTSVFQETSRYSVQGSRVVAHLRCRRQVPRTAQVDHVGCIGAYQSSIRRAPVDRDPPPVGIALTFALHANAPGLDLRAWDSEHAAKTRRARAISTGSCGLAPSA